MSKEIFILADSFDENIEISIHDTYEKAFNAMKGSLDAAFGFDTMDETAAKEHRRSIGDDYMIYKWHAWAYFGGYKNVLVIKKFEV